MKINIEAKSAEIVFENVEVIRIPLDHVYININNDKLETVVMPKKIKFENVSDYQEYNSVADRLLLYNDIVYIELLTNVGVLKIEAPWDDINNDNNGWQHMEVNEHDIIINWKSK